MIKFLFYRTKLHGFSICVDKEILSMKVSVPIDLEFDRTESKVGMLIFAKKSINSVLIYVPKQ